MPKEIGAHELANRALAQQTREDKNRRLAEAGKEAVRKSASARDKAEIGAALVERVKAAEKKRGKVRNSKSLTRRPQKGKS
jgi:hypothetical protein